MSSPWQLLCPPEIDPVGPSALDDIATSTGMDSYDSPQDALADIARYDAIIVRATELDSEVIDRANNLQVIAKHGTGLDNVDIAAASRNGIVVCNTPGVNAQSVAEHALALLFGVRRNLHTADRHVREGGWDRGAYTGFELQGSTLGLMGYGSIAQATATMARGIGIDVTIYDPHYSDELPAAVDRVESLTDLFAVADAVSLHAPLVESTRHAVSTAQLAALGADGVVVNTARGGIVDETALIAALDDGQIGGAGLDTFEDEPLGAEHPLCDYENVLLTPHLGGVTHDALAQMSREAAANVRAVYERTLPESTVNRQQLSQEVDQ